MGGRSGLSRGSAEGKQDPSQVVRKRPTATEDQRAQEEHAPPERGP